MKSPLRYPGGKTRACSILENIVLEHFDIQSINTIISPFFGGGSFEFYMSDKHDKNIIANDKFTPLVSFWLMCKNNNEALCDYLYNNQDVSKESFLEIRSNILNEERFNQACQYFIINRCSFSGATLSGGFSEEASKKRFTKSSIDRVKSLNLNKFTISNLDFEEFINKNDGSSELLFLDPPYFISSKLYGNKGDLHDLDHERLYQVLSTKTKWILTYNDCEYIRNLYKDYKIIDVQWSYSMTKKGSSEIVILCNT
jgi:DNA adenine methylase